MKTGKELLEVLSGAICREIDAFNYYRKAGKNSPLPETKALLIQLSEEERKHREILAAEYGRIKKLTSSQSKEYIKSEKISYAVPENFPFLNLRRIKGVEICAVNLPTRFLGGDYFDAFPIDINNRKLLGIVICDVMGHGTDATILKALFQSALNKIKSGLSNKERINLANPAWLVSKLNNRLWAECERRGSFVSVLYMVVDPERKKLTYTSAGHEPAILIRKKGKKSEELSDTGLLIGLEKARKYTQSELGLSSGDLVLLFTDGLIEVVNSKQEEYGRARLMELLKKNNQIKLSELLKKICQDLKRFNRGKNFKDEISIIALKMGEEKR